MNTDVLLCVWAPCTNSTEQPSVLTEHAALGCCQTINPSETFGDILIDYSYVELSSTCISALAQFNRKYPQHRAEEISRANRRGRKYILGMQRGDGSWYGSWGVCFTYAAWFGCVILSHSQPLPCLL